MTAPERFTCPEHVMRHAIELARQGTGFVEPNPAVGAVLVDAGLNFLAHGCHERFGGPHAEINALADLARRIPDEETRTRALAESTLFVTLEPCCHHGKTPPCVQAVIDAGIPRVVFAVGDPSPHVAGGGEQQLREAGISVSAGELQDEASALVAPFLKLVSTGRPWVHAKWAMTLDGRIASRTGMSKWISSEASRAIVHELRGRMDAVIVGAGTARVDDPLLTARPPGPRTPCRVVVDSHASVSIESQLVRTLDQGPVLVAAGRSAHAQNVETLRNTGVEVVVLEGEDDSVPVDALLQELGRRKMTNVLVEGGSGLLGSVFDEAAADELHVFVAPKVVGGAGALAAVGGIGLPQIAQRAMLESINVQQVDGDIYVHGVMSRAAE